MTRRTAVQAEKELRDNARLLRWWKAWHREQREAVLAGPHGAVLGELFRMIRSLQHVRPVQLIGLARSIDWAVIDADTKLTALHEFNAAVTRLRERNNMEPIDDTVESETPYRQLKAILFPPNGAPAGAQPGSNSETPVT